MRLTRSCQICAVLAAGAGLTLWPNASPRAAEPPAGLPSIEAVVSAGDSTALSIPAPPLERLRTVSVSIKDPGALAANANSALTVRLEPASPHEAFAAPLTKTLHLGDPDVLWTVRQPKDVVLRITISAPKDDAKTRAHGPFRVAIRVAELSAVSAPPAGGPVRAAASDAVAFEFEPNDTPETANPLTLGQTVYGLADDRAYLPRGAEPTEVERTAGSDWFRFVFDSEVPRLAFFSLDYVDRDIPPDVRIYTLRDAKLVEYTAGIDPQSAQRERPPRPGANKFTTRVLVKGTYYIWVDACQPEYQLRTKLFDVPPYLTAEQAEEADPAALGAAARRAVRTAMDFQLLAGDSWLANTPRKGHPLDRVANFHHETSTCIACHPTHFTTQSALAAVKAGYKVEQPSALLFLTERLANNPVPFHGHPQAPWARMIPAPANVLGRLSTIVMDYEDQVSRSRRDNLHRGIAEFLKLYYDGRAELPPDETNGNNPVSRYKVATDSWRQLDETHRRTGDPRYAATRDLVARLLSTGKPAHTRDLAAQTIGLCLIDPKREKLAAQIDSNVAGLLSLQRPNGHWSVKFDPSYPITEMQTGESLYALALGGLKPDQPAMRRGICALLLRQQQFGGWFDINPYEQFRTPFRETQWALIALSALYPDPRPRSTGWNGPLGQEPEMLRRECPATLIQDLERIWDSPKPGLLRDVASALAHESPLVRYAASQALGRVGDEASIVPLVRALGDESKVVRRSAAAALRLLGNRLSGSRRPSETPAQAQLTAELARALRSGDDRARRGATRVFAAHFRELSQESGLLGPMLERLDDPDPVVAMQAIKGLWRWWYWQMDPGVRDRIEDGLIAALAQPRHPWVRRNLIEALYIIGDDNIRYLYQNWVPALARAESRRRATEAQHATVNRLGAKYALALARGDRLQREGVLRAMSEFFERPVLGGRIGNDLEPTRFHDETAARVATVLIAAISDPDPTIRRLALQALVTVHGVRSAELALAIVRRIGDPDAAVRTWATTMAKEFPLEIKPGQADAGIRTLVCDLLDQSTPAAQAAALGILGRLGPLFEGPRHFDPAQMVRSRLATPAPSVRTAALEALRSFPGLWTEQPVRAAIERALDDANARARVAAILLALEPKAKIGQSLLRKTLENPAPDAHVVLLERIASDARLSDDLRLIGVVSNALVSEHGGVREKALALVEGRPRLLANAAIENSLREMAQARSTGERQREIARSLLETRGRASTRGAATEHQRLDIAYFQAKVLPIFNQLGEDGQNCQGCHRAHTILRLVAPGTDGQWTPQAVRENYRSALRVVNLARPAESLLVNKPTWEAALEAEAQTDPNTKAHTGGVRFEKGSREYHVLLDWINGARLPAASRTAAR